MPTLTTTPAQPLAERKCRITVHCTRGGTAIRLWCTDAPVGTKLRAELDKGAARVAFHGPAISDGKDFDFTPEAGGVYVLTLDELSINRTYGGDYQGDPRGAPSETLITSQTGVRLPVLSALTQKVGVPPDFATLRLFVSGDQIIETTVAAHGEVTPVLVLPAQPTARARTFAEWSSTKSAVQRLTQFTCEEAIGDMGAGFIGRMCQRFDLHRTQNGAHEHDDVDNAVGATYANPQSLAGQVRALAKLRAALRNHLSNTNPAESGGPGSAAYHETADWTNTLLNGAEPSESDATTIFAAAADTYRVMKAHFGDEEIHGAGTTMSGITTPPLAFVFYNAVVQLAALSPASPATVHSGAALLIAQAGFREA